MLARLRVTLVTHAYLAEENRKKLSLLGRDVDLEVVSPDRATTALFRYRMGQSVVESDSYRMRFYRPVPESGIPARYLLWSRDLHTREFRPDVVHVEGEPWTLLALQALRCVRRYRPQAAIVCTVRQNTYTTYGWLTFFKDSLARRAIRRVDRFLAGNAGSRRVLAERFGVPLERIQLNPQLGVDTEHFRPLPVAQRAEWRRRWGLADDAVVVGYCGRFVEEKGLLDLVEAARTVRARMGARLQLALLGDGPLRPQLESGADDDLVLHKTVPHDEVASFLQGLDIFVLPSLVLSGHEEHDAHALQEAMACGIASVGTTSGAISEILPGAGTVVPPASPAALAEALAQLLDPTTRRAFGEAGRQRILERYSNERIVETQLETYHQAVYDSRWRK